MNFIGHRLRKSLAIVISNNGLAMREARRGGDLCNLHERGTAEFRESLKRSNFAALAWHLPVEASLGKPSDK